MNVKYDSKTKIVTITFSYDANAEYPVSKSGKSRMVATSNGFMAVPGTVGRVSLNVINPVEWKGNGQKAD